MVSIDVENRRRKNYLFRLKVHSLTKHTLHLFSVLSFLSPNP